MAKTPDDGEGPFEQQREAFARGALQGEAQALRARQAQTPPGRRTSVVVVLVIVAVLAAVWMLVGRPLVQQTVEVNQDAGTTASPTPSSGEATPTAEVLSDEGAPAGEPGTPADAGTSADAPRVGAGGALGAEEQAVTESVAEDAPAPAPTETPGLLRGLVGDVGEIVDDVGDATHELTEGLGSQLGAG